MILAKIIFGTLIIIIFTSLLKLKYSNGLRILEKVIIIFQNLADLLSIQRGRDLLFYIYILSSFWLLFRCHIRINKLNSSINKLISKISILESINKK